jgi:hypothetical protein
MIVPWPTTFHFSKLLELKILQAQKHQPSIVLKFWTDQKERVPTSFLRPVL